jgi:gluconate 2-dehydrogenase subunit 3-like protein
MVRVFGLRGVLGAYTFHGGAMRAKLSRRKLLAGAAGLLVLGGSAVAIVRTRGYALPAGKVTLLLTPWQFTVVEHAARRITAPDRPPAEDPAIPSADDLDVATFVDAWLARMHPRVQRDLGRFLAYLEHLAPVGAGFASRLTRLAPVDQDRVLASVEASSSDLLRAGFEGLKSLVFMGYYRDPRTWKIVGYAGPFVGRKAS